MPTETHNHKDRRAAKKKKAAAAVARGLKLKVLDSVNAIVAICCIKDKQPFSKGTTTRFKVLFYKCPCSAPSGFRDPSSKKPARKSLEGKENLEVHGFRSGNDSAHVL